MYKPVYRGWYSCINIINELETRNCLWYGHQKIWRVECKGAFTGSTDAMTIAGAKTRQLLADIKQACTYVGNDKLNISTENNGVDWLSFEEHRLRLSFLLDRQLGPFERASEAWVH